MLDIVIPCANEPKYLARMLESIGKQIKDKSLIQIYIVDDCTKYEDEYKLVLGRFGNKYGMTDGESICYIRNEERLGPGGSRNKGIEAGEDEFICFWDDDDEIIDNPLKIIRNRNYDMYDSFEQKTESDGKISQQIQFNLRNAIHSLIFKKDFLIRNNLFFIEGTEGCEDCVFRVVSSCVARNIEYNKEIIYYNWIRRPDSHYTMNLQIFASNEKSANTINNFTDLQVAFKVIKCLNDLIEGNKKINFKVVLKFIDIFIVKTFFFEYRKYTNRIIQDLFYCMIYLIIQSYQQINLNNEDYSILLKNLVLFSISYGKVKNKNILTIDSYHFFKQESKIDKFLYNQLSDFVNYTVEHSLINYYDIISILNIYNNYYGKIKPSDLRGVQVL